MPGDVRTNALDDLLDAERHFRAQAENALRELQSVLTEQAQRLAGAQIEDARRTDPGAPENWCPDRWRKFFTSLPLRAGGDGWNDNLLLELELLKSENRTLKDRLASLPAPFSPVSASTKPENSSGQPTVDPSAVLPDSTTLSQLVILPKVMDLDPQGRTFAHLDLLGELRSLKLPTTLPARFQSHFPKPGLNETDRERQVRRKLYVLYLLGRGLDIRLEIDFLISQVEGIGSRSGALRRIYDSMVERNLISREVMEMSAPNTSLAMLQLTQDGRELCQILTWDVAESERQRMNRMHQGEEFPQHTLAVMIFAMHARFRSYRVGVLPEIIGVQTNAVPDVLVSRNLPDNTLETIFVEIELSNKELDAKWHNLSQLQGRVALCARNAIRRTRLIGDCKLKNLHGLATDLETLIACKVPDISENSPLWADEW